MSKRNFELYQYFLRGIIAQKTAEFESTEDVLRWFEKGSVQIRHLNRTINIKTIQNKVEKLKKSKKKHIDSVEIIRVLRLIYREILS